MDNYSRKCIAIKAGKSIKGRDVVEVMKTLPFNDKCLPKRIKVDN